MKYVINYGCGCGDNEMIVEAKSEQDALNYAYQLAIDEYDSYAGLHGIPDVEDVCEDWGIEDSGSDEAWEKYCEEREGWLDYRVTIFDENNSWHQDLLEDGAQEV